MIYDRMENLDEYTGLFKPLDTAIAWMKTHNLNELPMGKTVIDGDKVFVTVMECDTNESDGTEFETHNIYMDLQTDLVGHEHFEVSLGKLEETQAYNPDRDITFYNAKQSITGTLDADCFVIYMVGEAHKPAVRIEGCDKVKKVVFKIARE